MKATVGCSSCGLANEISIFPSVDVSTSPELREKVLDGSLFAWECPGCGTVNLAKYPFLYHDPSEKIMVVMTSANINADTLPEGYTGRLVRSVGELVEKVRIFDAGLDDIIIEMCKMITLQEMRRPADTAMKFVKMDGADSELNFTYPERGEMQMLAIGFNVYEDCAGILARNPAVRESLHGLAEVNPAWLSRYFG